LFVVLDVVTFVLVYWALLSSLAPVLTSVEPVVAMAFGWVVSAVRLTWIGMIAVRSLRRRHGLPERVHAVPTAVVAGLLAFFLHFFFGMAAALAIGDLTWSWLVLFDLAQWVGFPLLAVALVSAGPPERPLYSRRLLLSRERADA